MDPKLLEAGAVCAAKGPPRVSRAHGLSELDDAALIRLAQEDRREAWDVLIARHDHRVIVSLLARGVRIDRARELAQETWVRLVEQQRRGKLARLELPGLAIRQAAFFAQDEARRVGPASVHLDRSVDARAVAAPDASAEQRLVSRQQIERVQRELDRCSPTAQAVFHAIYDDPAVAHDQVAARFGLSVQRIRQTLCEVRARLRGALEES